MFFVLSKILDLALSPLTWTIVLFGLGIPWRRRARRRPWGKRGLLAMLGFGVLVVFSLEPVSARLRWSLEADVQPPALGDERYDAVIVLGGIVDERSTEQRQASSYNDNSERLLVAYELLLADRAANVILSGAASPGLSDQAGEPQVLVAQLERWGVARSRIFVEGRSMNTRENAVYTAELVRQRGWTKLLVVTSAFHMRRALGCFRKVGLPVTPYAVDFKAWDPAKFPLSWQPRAHHLDQSTAAIREFSGIWVYKLRGYAD